MAESDAPQGPDDDAGTHTGTQAGESAAPTWDPPQGWSPCEDRADPASWDDPTIVDHPDTDGPGGDS